MEICKGGGRSERRPLLAARPTASSRLPPPGDQTPYATRRPGARALEGPMEWPRRGMPAQSTSAGGREPDAPKRCASRSREPVSREQPRRSAALTCHVSETAASPVTTQPRSTVLDSLLVDGPSNKPLFACIRRAASLPHGPPSQPPSVHVASTCGARLSAGRLFWYCRVLLLHFVTCWLKSEAKRIAAGVGGWPAVTDEELAQGARLARISIDVTDAPRITYNRDV